jgi:hypothetical protein
MPSSKAAASKEAKSTHNISCEPFALRMDLGERKRPSMNSDIREPLSDARMPLGDFFSILLVVTEG